MISAFQSSAFQNNAFQISSSPAPSPSSETNILGYMSGGGRYKKSWKEIEEEFERLERLKEQLEAKQRAKEELQAKRITQAKQRRLEALTGEIELLYAAIEKAQEEARIIELRTQQRKRNNAILALSLVSPFTRIEV